MKQDKKRVGAPAGNTNRQIGEIPASSQVQFRCSGADKAAWILAAHSEDLKLTEWIITRLNANP